MISNNIVHSNWNKNNAGVFIANGADDYLYSYYISTDDIKDFVNENRRISGEDRGRGGKGEVNTMNFSTYLLCWLHKSS